MIELLIPPFSVPPAESADAKKLRELKLENSLLKERLAQLLETNQKLYNRINLLMGEDWTDVRGKEVIT